jgi:hypothetical protein
MAVSVYGDVSALGSETIMIKIILETGLRHRSRNCCPTNLLEELPDNLFSPTSAAVWRF